MGIRCKQNFEVLNTQQPNIKFTFEIQVNKQVSFLDVLITNDGDQFCTSVFRKETAIGLFTNYLDFTPFSYKVGFARTLLHHAFMISSSLFVFHEEVIKIKHYLEKNSYPLSFVDKKVKFFTENKINEKTDTVDATNNVLPYVFHVSTDVKCKINRFCKIYCKSLSIKIVLTPFKVADMFNVKDPVPKSLKSFFVYKLFVHAAMPVTLVRQLAICQQGLRSIWKRIKSSAFLHILLIMELARHLVLKIVLR